MLLFPSSKLYECPTLHLHPSTNSFNGHDWSRLHEIGNKGDPKAIVYQGAKPPSKSFRAAIRKANSAV